MGFEYSLRFKAVDQSAVEQLLSRIEGASRKDAPLPVIEFRRDQDKAEDMPDATVQVQATGLYFCDHGGFGREFLGQVVALLVGAFGGVTVEELE